MRFESLSDAIKYYSSQTNPLANATPYGELASETIMPPQNINAFTQNNNDGIVYGQSIWGIGAITSVNKPKL